MKKGLSDDLMALRVVKELKGGDVVNLGIGFPLFVSDFIHPELGILLQSENGVLGFGRILRPPEEGDPHCVNAGGYVVQMQPGISFCHSADSFAMIRGGHVDVTILGGLQVSERGDLANWMIPGRSYEGVGGAMDLAVGARRVIVVMEHTTKDEEPKILRECTYPLTAKGVVELIITDLAVIEVTGEGLLLKEVAPGFSVEEVQARTEPRLIVAEDLHEISP